MVIAVMMALLGGSHPVRPPGLRVVVMDVGQGLAVLVQTADHALVYDAGPAFASADAGRSVIVPTLRRFGIARLDTLLISHGDADHLGGASTLLAQFPEAELIAPERYGLNSRRYRRCVAGMEWHWEGVRFRILHPGRGENWSDNDGSCVLLVQSGGVAILLPGDIERRAEGHLVSRARLAAVDLVIAPHHGSQSSSSPAFVGATRPRFIVFSAGYLNRWGFPHAGVAHRWTDAGACPLITGENGALVFEPDEAGRLVLQWRQRIDGHRLWTERGDGLRPPCRLL
jgi:competence protein ComEC